MMTAFSLFGADLINLVWMGGLEYVTHFSVVSSLVMPLKIPFLQYNTSSDRIKNIHLVHSYSTTETSTEEKPLSACEKFSDFFNAPITKFWVNFIPHSLRVAMFSNFMLSDERSKCAHMVEYFTASYAVAYLIEQAWMFVTEHEELSKRIKDYFSLQHNLCDFTIMTTCLLGFSIRISGFELFRGFNMLHIADIFYSCALIFSFFRILYYLVVFKDVGPYIIMLNFMFRDLTAFLVIMTTMILGFGIGMESVLSATRNSNQTIWLDLWGFMMKPSMMMYGFSLFLEDITDAFNCTGGDSNIFRFCSRTNTIRFLSIDKLKIVQNVLFCFR